MIWETIKVVKIPIIGVGGITSAENAIEMFLAGANSIQVGFANFSNPMVMLDIIEGIEKYLIRKKYSSIKDIFRILN